MTLWRPASAPYIEFQSSCYTNGSGTGVVYSKFRKVITAIPIANTSGYKNQSRANGFSIVKSGNAVRVCMNGSHNTTNASGTLGRAVGSQEFDILIIGVQ